MTIEGYDFENAYDLAKFVWDPKDVVEVVHVVIAGNYRQFVDWCQRRGLDHRSGTYRYAFRPEDLRDLKRYDVVKTGTWYGGELLDYIEQDIRSGRATWA